MRHLVRQDDAAAAAYLTEKLGIDFAHPFVGLVVGDGAVIVNNFDRVNVDMTACGSGCWSVRVIREIARYVFNVLCVKRVSAKTRVGNVKARKALEALGFVQEGVLRAGFGDEDAVLYGLLAAEQRILRN